MDSTLSELDKADAGIWKDLMREREATTNQCRKSERGKHESGKISYPSGKKMKSLSYTSQKIHSRRLNTSVSKETTAISGGKERKILYTLSSLEDSIGKHKKTHLFIKEKVDKCNHTEIINLNATTKLRQQHLKDKS